MLEWNRANANRKHVRAFSLLIQFLRGICNICGKIYSFKTGNSFERLENFMVFLFIFRSEFLSEQKNRIWLKLKELCSILYSIEFIENKCKQIEKYIFKEITCMWYFGSKQSKSAHKHNIYLSEAISGSSQI